MGRSGEAMATAAKACRAANAMCALLPPPGLDGAAGREVPPEAAKADAWTRATDELREMLSALPTGAAAGASARAAAVRRLTAATGKLLREESLAAATLVGAAHTPRGKRALSKLGEACESFADAAMLMAHPPPAPPPEPSEAQGEDDASLL